MRKRIGVCAIALAISMGLIGCSQSGGSQAAAGAAETTEAKQAEETVESDGMDAAKTEDTANEEESGKESKDVETEEVKEETEGSSEAETVAEINHSGFLFQSGDVTIGMNEDVAPALSGLGAYDNYAESPSCAFKGLDKIYSYQGFDLYTYPKGSADYVNSIYFIDDSVSTPEGIRLGSTTEEMLAAYGEDYTEEYGVYTYTKDKSTLSFIVTDGVIESVEYIAITE